jgi:hypothetical protein
MTLVFSIAALVRFIVRGMVKVEPAARVLVGSPEYWKIWSPVAALLMDIAFDPTVQDNEMTEV